MFNTISGLLKPKSGSIEFTGRRIDGKPTRSHDDYYNILESYEPGDTVEVTSRLGDKNVTYRVELIESQ